jgi:hypothetical protein
VQCTELHTFVAEVVTGQRLVLAGGTRGAIQVAVPALVLQHAQRKQDKRVRATPASDCEVEGMTVCGGGQACRVCFPGT